MEKKDPTSGYACAKGDSSKGGSCPYDHKLPPSAEDIKKFNDDVTIAIITDIVKIPRKEWDNPGEIANPVRKAQICSFQNKKIFNVGLVQCVKNVGSTGMSLASFACLCSEKKEAVVKVAAPLPFCLLRLCVVASLSFRRRI